MHFCQQCHPQRQRLNCAGCSELFHSASALMSHIEQDTCSVIRLTDYRLQRVERQLEKDAWESHANPFGASQAQIDAHAQGLSAATLSNLDNVPVSRADRSLHNAIGGPISTTSKQQFPPLTPRDQNRNSTTSPSIIPEPNNCEAELTKLKISDSIWTQDLKSTIHEQPGSAVSTEFKVQGWLDDLSTSSKSPSRHTRQTTSNFSDEDGGTKINAAKEQPIPSSPQISDPNPHAEHNHIKYRPAAVHSVISSSSIVDVERYWDASRQAYVCSGHGCHGKGFQDQQLFRDHMLSPTHINGHTTCPSCLKYFRTQTAFLAHAASGSRTCRLKESVHFNTVLREATAGMIGAEGFMDDGVTPKFTAQEIQDW